MVGRIEAVVAKMLQHPLEMGRLCFHPDQVEWDPAELLYSQSRRHQPSAPARSERDHREFVPGFHNGFQKDQPIENVVVD
jgi:hypothetical protein